MPDELWTGVHDIVQETGIKTVPKKNKFKKAKWSSEEALQIDVKRREAKSQGEKERYKHLNAEFQRIDKQEEIRKPSSAINAKKLVYYSVTITTNLATSKNTHMLSHSFTEVRAPQNRIL